MHSSWTANQVKGHACFPEFRVVLIVSLRLNQKVRRPLAQVFAHSFAIPNLPGPPAPTASVAVAPDGYIFAVDGDSIVGLMDKLGGQIQRAIEDSSYSSSSQCALKIRLRHLLRSWSTIIAGDGYFSMPYEFLETQTVATYAQALWHSPVCNRWKKRRFASSIDPRGDHGRCRK